MKIAIDIGHNIKVDGGAVDIGNENLMNAAVGNNLISMLARAKVEVITCKPIKALSVNDSLQRRVDAANNDNADYFISIHHNAGGGRGCEVYYVSSTGCKLANAVSNQIAKLGFKNRGAKKHAFKIIRDTNMPAILVEGCFVDSQSDMDLWNQVGPQAMAKAIYDGLNSVLKFEP